MSQKLINLKSSEYEHPFDRAALEKINAIPILPQVVNFAMNWTAIKWQIISLCGSNFHVTRDSCKDLFALAKRAAETIDVQLPNLYTEQSYYINAYTTGYKEDAYVVVTMGAIDKLSDEELSFVVGHELGHYKSGHVLYHLMAQYFAQLVTQIPFGSTLTAPLGLALKYWNRMSEFTADRAGLLACQDLNATLSAIMKMSGFPERYYTKASVEGFMQQAKEFDQQYGGTTDKIIKTISIIDEDHPWTIVRAAELIRWVESGEYDRILNKTKGKECPVCHHAIVDTSATCPYCGRKIQ